MLEGQRKKDEMSATESQSRLILAAPELLAACKKAVDLISSEYCSHAYPCSANKKECYVSEFLKVIDKAEGRTT